MNNLQTAITQLTNRMSVLERRADSALSPSPSPSPVEKINLINKVPINVVPVNKKTRKSSSNKKKKKKKKSSSKKKKKSSGGKGTKKRTRRTRKKAKRN